MNQYLNDYRRDAGRVDGVVASAATANVVGGQIAAATGPVQFLGGAGVILAGATYLLGTATVLASLDGVTASAVVAATGAVLAAWTLGQTSVDLANANEAARTTRLELVHVAGTTAVVTAAGSLALVALAFDVSASPVGVVLVLFGAGTLTATLFIAD